MNAHSLLTALWTATAKPAVHVCITQIGCLLASVCITLSPFTVQTVAGYAVAAADLVVECIAAPATSQFGASAPHLRVAASTAARS